MQERAVIRYYRYDRPPAVYNEGFVLDDGQRLRTYSVIPVEFGTRLAGSWIRDGLLTPGTTLYALSKHHFYGEYFTILELLGPQGNVLGYYSDIATPLEKNEDGEYELHDLILDLWVFPDGKVRELDWDEFNLAERRGVIPHHLAVIAKRTLQRLVQEANAGRFPVEYIK